MLKSLNPFKLFLVCFLTLIISGCQNTPSFISPPITTSENYSPYLTYISTNNSQNPEFISENEIENQIINLFPDPEIINKTISEYSEYLSSKKHFYILENPNKYDYCLYAPFIKNPPEVITTFKNPYHIEKIGNNLKICTSKLDFTIIAIPQNSFLVVHNFNTTNLNTDNYFLNFSIYKLLSNTPISLKNEENQIVINSSENSIILAQHNLQTYIDYTSTNFLNTKKTSNTIKQKYSNYYLSPELLNLIYTNSILYQENPDILQIAYDNNTIAAKTFEKISSSLLLQNTYEYQTFILPDNTESTSYSQLYDQKINPIITDNTITYTNTMQEKVQITLSGNYIIISNNNNTTTPSPSVTNIIPHTELSQLNPEFFEPFDFIKSIQFTLSNDLITGYVVK